MTYPGNAALAPDVQKRLQETFVQTLELVAAGKRQEAMLGCDFILQMDPLFEPARRLAEDLRGGAAGPADGEGFDSLAALDAVEEPVPDYGLGDRYLEGPADEPAVDFGLPPLEGDEGLAAAGVADDPAAMLRAHAAARRWQDLFELAAAVPAVVAADPGLGRLLAEAHAAAEAEPYVRRFLDAAALAVQAGDGDEVERLLAKARALDPAHPGIAEILAKQARYADPDRRMGGRRQGIEMPSAEPAVPFAATGAAFAAPASDESTFELDANELPELSFADLPGDEPEIAAPPAAPAPEPAFGGFGMTPPGGGAETSFGDLGGETSFASLGSGPGLGSPGALGGGIDLGLPADLGALPALEPEAPASAGSESDQRIADLLQEGRTAFAAGDYQGAIDAWSRIFLVDIDHPEAARLIEGARKAKAEIERRAEENFHEAVDAIEGGDLERAKTALAAVLAAQPGHVAAREYLAQIEAGRKPEPPPRSREGSGTGPSLARLEAPSPAAVDLKEEIMVPPEPGDARPVRAREAAGPIMAAKKGKPIRTLVTVGALVLVVVGVGGWFLLTQRERLFPNSQPAAPAAAPAPAAQTVDVLERARKLRDEGKAASAIALLKRIPPSSPQYRAAQPLLAELEGAVPKPAGDPAADADAQRRAQLLERAREAFAQRELLRAREMLKLAAVVAPLEGEEKAMQAEVDAGLAPLEKELEMFESGEYEMVLPRIWKLHEANRNDPDIRRLLVDAYYNVAVTDLQRGDAARAAQSLGEALAVDPDDATMKRLYQLAQTYAQRSPDLLYRTYVKYLATR